MTVIDKIASYKTKSVNRNTQKWFDGEILEKLNSKLFRKFRKSWLHIDKKNILESIDVPWELWEILKYIGMPNKTLFSNFTAMKDHDALICDIQ